MFTPIWGRFPCWLIYFQIGWNHQPVMYRGSQKRVPPLTKIPTPLPLDPIWIHHSPFLLDAQGMEWNCHRRRCGRFGRFGWGSRVWQRCLRSVLWTLHETPNSVSNRFYRESSKKHLKHLLNQNLQTKKYKTAADSILPPENQGEKWWIHVRRGTTSFKDYPSWLLTALRSNRWIVLQQWNKINRLQLWHLDHLNNGWLVQFGGWVVGDTGWWCFRNPGALDLPGWGIGWFVYPIICMFFFEKK